MEIAVISPVPVAAGGIGRAADAHARLLRERGHAVTLFAPGTTRSFRFRNAAFMPDAIRRARDFDAVLLEYPCFGTAELLALRRPRNLVLYYHMDVVGRGLYQPLFALHRRLLLPLIIFAARRVLVSSLDYARTSFIAGHEVREVPLGVDTSRFSPGTVRPDGRTVLFVGGLDRAHYFKGLDVLMRAMQNVSDAKLVVVGDGPLRAEYERRAVRTTFPGRVSDEQLPDVYRQADVLVLPSVDRSEAFGFVLLEAQACGVPVIASDLPGVRTALEEGKTGLLVPPGDAAALAGAIRTLLGDASRRRAMGHAARAFAEKFDWKIVGDRLDYEIRNTFGTSA